MKMALVEKKSPFLLDKQKLIIDRGRQKVNFYLLKCPLEQASSFDFV